MDHDDVLEQIELAAVEPDGLDRLMAGDTAMAAAVVGHLAGCDRCSEEMRRLSRAAPLLRDVVRTTPPADLRDRTLAYVEGARPRRGAPTQWLPRRNPSGIRPGRPSRPPRRGAVVFPPGRWPRRRRSSSSWARSRSWPAVPKSTGTATRSRPSRAVNRATLDISADPDAQRVALASTGGSPTSGTLLYSPSTTELVVVATDLAAPPSGKEYRCWVVVDGQRHDVGRMFFADDLAFWVGDTPEVSDLPDGTTFGVSLSDVGSSSLDADPVIVGEV